MITAAARRRGRGVSASVLAQLSSKVRWEVREAAGAAVEALESRTMFDGTGGYQGPYWGCILAENPAPYCDCQTDQSAPSGGPAGNDEGSADGSPPPKPVLEDPNALAGMADAKSAGTSSDPVRYFDGSPVINAVDLSSSAFGGLWGQSRSWSEAQITGILGNHWVDSDMPYLIGFSGGIWVNVTGTEGREFGWDGTTAHETFGQGDTLVHGTDPITGDGIFTLTDSAGGRTVFDDLTWGTNHPGQFESYTDPYGNVTRVVSHDANGEITDVQRSEGANVESWVYTYGTCTNEISDTQDVITNVTLRRSADGGHTWGNVEQVQYAYYDGSTAGGGPGDLASVTVEDASGNPVNQTVYRYWKAVSGGDQTATGPDPANPGSTLTLNQQPGTVKAVFGNAAIARAQAGTPRGGRAWRTAWMIIRQWLEVLWWGRPHRLNPRIEPLV